MPRTNDNLDPTHDVPSRPAGAMSPRVRALLWMLVVVVVLGGTANAIFRGLTDRPDWTHFRAESRYIWEHRESSPRTTMFGYLPAAPLLLGVFTLPFDSATGCVLWAACNALCAAGCIWVVRRWWLPASAPPEVLLVATVLLCPNFAHAIGAAQLTMGPLLLTVAGLALAERKRPLIGGGLIGVATVFKTMPAILGLYLLLRRKWLAAIGMAVGFAIVDFAPCVLALGVDGTIREHRAFLDRVGWHSNRVNIENPLLRADRHGSNEAYSLVLTRWLCEPPDVRTQVTVRGTPPPGEIDRVRATLQPGDVLFVDPMPPPVGEWDVVRTDLSWIPRFHIANLSTTGVTWIWASTLALGLAALVIATWRSSRANASVPWAIIAAVWLLAMFWVSPMMRRYYLPFAFPAMVLVCHLLLVQLRACDGRWTLNLRGMAAAVWMWIVGIACLGAQIPRWYGVHLLAVAVLLIAAVVAWRSGPSSALTEAAPNRS